MACSVYNGFYYHKRNYLTLPPQKEESQSLHSFQLIFF